MLQDYLPVLPSLRSEVSAGTKTAQASAVGELVAKRAADKGIKEVVFDRGGFLPSLRRTYSPT